MFDINKPYTTRGGKKAHAWVLPKLDDLGYAFVGYFEDADGEISTGTWTPDGRYNAGEKTTSLDLINVPEKRTVKGWLNAYDDHHGMDLSMVHPSKAQADLHSSSFRKRIACIEREITYTVGEGL